MAADLVDVDLSGTVSVLTLNRPEQRNALTSGMMSRMIDALEEIASGDGGVVLLRGNGPSFCAGFDLADAVAQPGLMGRYIEQLGAIARALRRVPQVVVAAVQGAALAGGCAIVSACDFVVASPQSQFGYPVHRIGVSPAVSIPTLRQLIGDGRCRSMLMGGQIIDGAEAARLGLVSHLLHAGTGIDDAARRLCESLAGKGQVALRATKRWISELDGSLEDAPFERSTAASAAAAVEPEAQRLVQAFWSLRRDLR
ncbi:MAG: enoyl-CoA hydratase/isomerase family protein [Phycisphaerales bacterium]|nr:enoyl-CoA hydratase/isomerase family protein [Phycisphaerales bacterium]